MQKKPVASFPAASPATLARVAIPSASSGRVLTAALRPAPAGSSTGTASGVGAVVR